MLWQRPGQRNDHQDGPDGLLERIFAEEEPGPGRERRSLEAALREAPGAIRSLRAPVPLPADF